MLKAALWAAAGVAAGFVLLSVVVAVLPRDFFTRPRRARGVGKILKNALGVILIAAGVVLSLPLVPGPGFVLLLVGLALVDFPGRRKLLRKAILKPAVHRKLNAFRRKLHRPYFLLPEA
ncbi:MAG TPA: hypothetical protein VF950_06810 [Planctomycetota bacterium]